jgi:DtxR family Mn-dependent transcriptional regulator
MLATSAEIRYAFPAMNNADHDTQPSITMREYLAEIYRLQEDNPTVSTTSLADRLGVSAPAVPRMLKRLKSAGLVKHVPYQGVELTDMGRKEALREIRRHRILEVFLVQTMRFSWDEAHDHADELARGTNDAILERMAQMAGHPTRCPHGEPIPTPEGEIVYPADMPLLNASVGYRGVISRVRTYELEKLRYLGEQGVRPGVPVEVAGRAPFNGPMRLRLGPRQELVLGVELARTLWVE